MSGFADYLPEVFEEFGAVTLQRMFGGHGVYHQGLVFALVIADILYLKSDALTQPLFEREGLEAFSYETRSGRRTVMSYRRAPDEIFDDREQAARWARIAFEAALRAQQKPAGKKKAVTKKPAAKKPPGKTREK